MCGPPNWRNKFGDSPGAGVLCCLEIRTGGEWIGKWDGAAADEAFQGIDMVKASLSSAMKRAAVQWGIGRYLYREKPKFADIHEGGRYAGKTSDGILFRWDPPGSWGAGRASGPEQRSGSDSLTLAEAKKQMDAAGKPQALLDWLTANRERIGGFRNVAMEYFNKRLRALKEM